MAKRVLAGLDLTSNAAVSEALSVDRLARTVHRMGSRKDADDLVSHPLQRLILAEYSNRISESLSEVVKSGQWRPSPSYLVLVRKRSGAFRETVYPSILDSVVARRLTDELEEDSKKNDDGRAFFGRAHSSSHRSIGEYDNWFQVWQDYRSRISAAAASENLVVVFETDIADFFLSVPLDRAREAVIRESKVVQPYIDLLFDCLQMWAPRFNHSAVGGLPTEPNDVSRLVAHIYLRGLDASFNENEGIHYLRYVDDTVIFVPDPEKAEEVRLRHFLQLRALGLNPNASKTRVVDVGAFEAARHVDVNRRLDNIKNQNQKEEFSDLVQDWYKEEHREVASWDQVSRRMYSVALRTGFQDLRKFVIDDIEKCPGLTPSAVKYLSRFEVCQSEVHALLAVATGPHAPLDSGILVLRLLSDCRFASDVNLKKLRNQLRSVMWANDGRPGAGYIKMLALFFLLKHSPRDERETLGRSFNRSFAGDHYFHLGVGYAQECFESDLGADWVQEHPANDDHVYMRRLVDGARGGQLANLDRLLTLSVETRWRESFIRSSYLPWLRAVFKGADQASPEYRKTCLKWGEDILSKQSRKLQDNVTRSLLDASCSRLRQ